MPTIDLSAPDDRVFLTLFGTGLRHRGTAVSARIGGESAEVFFAGPQGDFVGLDQINLLLPRGLAGRGMVNIELTADGLPANMVAILIK